MAEENDPNTGQPDIRSLRAAAEGKAAVDAENAALKRELMFAKAGIDTESKLGKMLFKTWEGDDLGELKAEAIEVGALGTSTPPPPSNDDTSGQQDFRKGLSSGVAAGAYTPPEADPRDVAIAQFHADVQRGVPAQDAQLAAFDRIFSAAVAGDARAIFNPEDWKDTYRN